MKLRVILSKEVNTALKAPRNFDNIVDAFKKCIDNEKLSCTLIQRGWRIFLRNDSIPVSEIEYYGKAIRREGKKCKSSKS